MQEQQRPFSRILSVLLLTSTIAGCTGNILGNGNATEDQQPSQPESPSSSPSTVDWSVSGPAQPGASYLRRLTNAEYDSTVHDLLGESGDVAPRAAEFDFVPDTRVHGFESNATNVNMSAAVLERYRAAAEAISEQITSDDETRQRVLGCEPGADASCTRGFIERFGRRVYRRPLSSDEIERLEALAAGAGDALEGSKLVVQHLLLSPNFLFRIEHGVADQARPELRRLSGFEIATRLSYLLLGTTPAPALLDAAEAGELDSAAGVETTARALLADTRARSAVRRFYDQWLRLDRVADLDRDAVLFPEFDAELAASMREETNRLLDELIWEPGRSFIDFVSSTHTFVDPRLAALYGLPATSGWQKIELSPELGRAGVLGHAGLLAQTSRRDRTSSTLRGRYVREVLLCYPLPALPADVPQLPEPVPGQSERERLGSHTAEPVCAGCHELLDPLGFGLSQFDALGKFRTVDEAGQPVSAAGSLNGYELADPTFEGEVELAARLRELPELAQCVVTQLFRHSFARLEQPADGALLGTVFESFAGSGYSFQELLVAFVTSDAFRYREPNELQEAWP